MQAAVVLLCGLMLSQAAATSTPAATGRIAGRIVADVMVVAYERVTVPAGEFAAYKLEAKSHMGGKSPRGSLIDAESFTTYWYAPAARAVVKWVQRHPYLGPSTVELATYALQP